MAVGARCGWVVTTWPAAAVCLMFAARDILHWVNTPACCLLPAAYCRLLVLTYHEQHSVESGLLGPNINVSERTYFACAEAEQSGECGGVFVLGARGSEEGRWARENNFFALKQHRAFMKNILFCLGGPHLLSLFQTFELIISENLGGFAYF